MAMTIIQAPVDTPSTATGAMPTAIETRRQTIENSSDAAVEKVTIFQYSCLSNSRPCCLMK
jgi:hypothetical protein